MDDHHISKVIPRLPGGSWAAPKPPPAPSLDSRLCPLSPTEALMELSRCLTLCAPSGWSVEDRAEWLTIAMADIGEFPAEVFREACKQARRTCDHPAKLVPAICAYAEPQAERLRLLLRNTRAPHLFSVKIEPPPAMTQADADATPAHLIELGISCGALARNADGTICPATQ